MKKIMIILGLIVLIGVPLYAVSAIQFDQPAGSQTFSIQGIGLNSGGSACDQDPNCYKAEGNSGTSTAPGDIVQFIIKSGNNDFTFTESGTYNIPGTEDPCYVVTITGKTVTWNRVGTGSNCQDISHVQIWWQPGQASASAAPGACVWTETTGAEAPVTITVSNASLTLTGPNNYSQTFTSSTTINLPPGNYNYSWTANQNYSGSGTGGFTIQDCTPGDASASAVPGACVWTEATGAEAPVTITVSNASLTLTGPNNYSETFTTNATRNLAPGFYEYTWGPKNDDYIGSGSGNFTILDCSPGTADASAGPSACVWTIETGPYAPVSITVSNASLTLTGPNNYSEIFTTNDSVNLPPGTYNYSWTANQGYVGEGSGSFTIEDCTPKEGADAEVTIGGCTWDGNKSLIMVNISLFNAELTINEVAYTENAEIKLEPGTYAYSWVATNDSEESGGGSITLYGCEPATASINLGGCEWFSETEESKTTLTMNINGATLNLLKNDVAFGTYSPGTHIIDLGPGKYAYNWTANQDYTGSGSGIFTTIECEPGKGTANVELGACVWNPNTNTSLTEVIITLSNAALTIDGETYDESTTIQLPTGEYAYEWVAVGEENEGEGSGTLVVQDCPPKEEPTPTPTQPASGPTPNPTQVDQPAGGSGPSSVSILTPAAIGIAGLALAWVLLKDKVFKKN